MSDWRGLYAVVLRQEQTFKITRQAIVDAQNAILERSKALGRSNIFLPERDEMVEATSVLTFLLRRIASRNLNTMRGTRKNARQVF
jgi:hypothetical protein